MRVATVSIGVATAAFVLSAIVPATADVLIRVDKNGQRMVVSVDGQPRYVWSVSTGAKGYETPSGSFRASQLERTYFSRKYDNAPMPNAIFFTANGHAIHGTTHGRNLGRPASHGCVRLSLRHAATLFSIVKAEGMANTRVVVDGDPPAVANRGRSGFKQARRQERYDRAGVMSAGMQMGVEGRPFYDRPTTRRRLHDTYFYPDQDYSPVYIYDEY